MEVDVRAELDKLIRQHGEEYTALSRMIGRNPAYIQQFIKRGTPKRLAEEDRVQLASYFRVPEELLGGRAQPLPPVSAGKQAQAGDIVLVPRVDVRASAGPGQLAEVEPCGPLLAFDGAMLRGIAGPRLAGLSVIRVAGNSMEPTLGDGDDILVDRNDGVDRLRSGVYVLRLDDMLMVKRLLPGGTAGRFIIRSDNPDHPAPAAYDPAMLQVIGRVIWAGRRIP